MMICKNSHKVGATILVALFGTTVKHNKCLKRYEYQIWCSVAGSLQLFSSEISHFHSRVA